MPQSAHVLFVEDEEYRNEKLVRYLRAHGVEVTMAGTLADALHAVGEGDFGCVLLDVMLPPGDGENNDTAALTAGVEFLRRLRGGGVPGADPQLPVVVLTARAAREVEDEMRALGVRAFLIKPESMKVLLDTIRGAVGLEASA